MQQNKLQFSDANCQTLLPLGAQISIVSLQSIQFSHSFEILLLIAEYFQLATQTLLLYDNLYDITQLQNPFHAALIYLAKILNPGLLFGFEEGHYVTWFMLSAMLLYSALRYTLFGFIIILAIQGKEPNKTLALIWKWIFKLQARVLYGAVTSFWVQCILQVNTAGKFTIFGAEKTSVVIIFTILTISEFAFCFWLKARYYLLLPTKSLLSTKDTRIETMNLAQKFVLQILQIMLQNAFTSSGSSKDIIFAAINLVFTLCRVTYHFAQLPLYNFKGLLCEGILIMIFASFNVSRFFQIIIYWTHSNQDLDYIMTIWAILSLLTTRLAYGYLSRSVLSLATENQVRVPFLIQKLNIIWQYKEQKRMPVNFAYKFEALHLTNMAIDASLQTLLGSTEKSKRINNFSTDSEEYFDYLCVYHLEAALATNPKDHNIIKLYLAELYAKRLSQYGQAIKYLVELKDSSINIIAQNASVLIWCIQNKMRIESVGNKKNINIHDYFHSQNLFNSIQKKILKQSELQMSLYQELMEKVPDLTKVYNYSREVHSYRQRIQHEGNKVMNTIEKYHTVPVLLYAQYQLLLNHSLASYFKHFRTYAQRYQHYQRNYQDDEITPENYFHERTTMLLVSNQKENHGKILYCAKSISSIFGGDDNRYLGAHISMLSPLNKQNFELLFDRTNTDNTEQNNLNRAFRGYCNHKNGHMIEVNFYVDIFPFLTQGFYYCVFIRQVQMSEECILIDENGIIQGATKDIMQSLELKKFTHIRLYSEELAQINNAFNYAVDFSNDIPDELDMETKEYQSRRKYSKTNRLTLYENNLKSHIAAKSTLENKKASELYSIFSTQGKEIQITKFNRTFTYNCKVTTLSDGPSIMRLISLKEQQGCFDSETYGLSKPKSKTSPEESRSGTYQQEGSSNMEWIGLEYDNQLDMKLLREKQKEKEPVQTRGEDLGTSLMSRNLTTEGNLLSPLSIGKSNRKSTIEMLSQSLENKLKKIEIPDRKSNQNETKKQGNGVKARGYRALNASRSSKTSHAKLVKISQSLDSALLSRYYPKYLRLFSLFFYLLLHGLLASQIHLNSLLDGNINDLRIKKEIVKNAQLRDYSLVIIYRSYRVVIDTQTGSLGTDGQTQFITSASDYVDVANSSISNLVKANQNLQLNAGLVDKSLRGVLFSEETRVFYNNGNMQENYMNYTTFQATDLMTSAALDVLSQAKINITNQEQSLNLIFRNAMNDLLINTEAATSIFMEAVEIQVQQEQKIIQASEIVMTILLGMSLIMFIFMIVTSYSRAKLSMIALTKFDMNEIKDLQDRIANFGRVIETMTPEEGVDILQSSEGQHIFVFGKKFRDNKSFKFSNHSGILKRYLSYIAKTVILCAGLIAIPIITSGLASNSINFLYKEQSTLYFVDSMSKIINMAYLTYRDLYSTNGASYIRNEPVSVQFAKAIDDLGALRNTFLDTFLNDADPVFSKILQGPDCSFIINTTSVDYCSYLKGLQKQLSLVSLLSDYENLIKQKQDAFYSSDRSFQTLKDIQTQNYDLIVATLRVLLNEAEMVSDRTDVIFENKFGETKTQGKLTLAISAILICVFSVLLWMLVLRELREGPNRFKNLLQNFPPNLILSNFIIKSFLIRTSESVFDLNKLNL